MVQGWINQHHPLFQTRSRREEYGKLSEAIAPTSGVPPGFFFADYVTGQAGLLDEEVELLALVRSASISAAQLRAIAALNPAARQAVINLIIALTAAR